MTPLPPFAPEWLAVEQMMGGRMTLQPESVEELRAKFANIFAGVAPFIPPPTTAVKTEDVQVNGRRIRIYIPTASPGPHPVGLYIHSGGWFTGSIENEDHLCRSIAEHSNIILFSPDYRLAPEHPYPAGLNDCCAVYEWMHHNASQHHGDNERKYIMGVSAGGNLTACVALKYASDALLRPSGLIIGCLQSCDVTAFPEEYKKRYTPELYADSPMIGRAAMLKSSEWYAPPHPTDPLYSPLLHPDLKLLPPTYLIATTKDPTHQDTVFLGEEMRKQGVNVDLVEWEGWPHCFWFIPMLPKTAEFMEVWNQKLRGLIEAAA